MKCELYRCMRRGLDNEATVYVNENIGDASYRVAICAVCANAINVLDGQDLPEPDIVKKRLDAASKRPIGHVEMRKAEILRDT